MLQAIDAHIHLEKYSDELCDEIIAQAAEEGVIGIVAVSMDLPSSKRTHQLYTRYKKLIIPAYGFHPEQELPTLQEENELVTWIEEKYEAQEAFAIGEIGLPYYNRLEAHQNDEPFDDEPYVLFLDRMLKLAKRLERPVVLHAVYEDAEIVIELLKRHEIKKAHFHWFKGPEHSIRQMIEAGYYISITPDVFVEEEIRELVKRYPLELIMVETDGPWPFEGPFEGKQTVPAMTVEVVKEIARLKQLNSQTVAEVIYENTKRFYS